jgi:hypothetical protein
MTGIWLCQYTIMICLDSAIQSLSIPYNIVLWQNLTICTLSSLSSCDNILHNNNIISCLIYISQGYLLWLDISGTHGIFFSTCQCNECIMSCFKSDLQYERSSTLGQVYPSIILYISLPRFIPYTPHLQNNVLTVPPSGDPLDKVGRPSWIMLSGQPPPSFSLAAWDP